MPRKDKRSCNENPLEMGCHAPDLNKLAKDCLKEYFRDKSWFVGGPIPERLLLSENSIKTLLRTEFNAESIGYLHEHCLPKIRQPSSYTETTVPWTVAFLIQLFTSMAKRGIPKDFQAGMAFLYFNLCKGFTIPSPDLYDTT